MIQPAPPTTGDSSRPDLSTPVFLGLILLIGLAGLVLRVVDLDTIPPGLHFDQAANGLLGLEILSGQAHPVFFSSYAGREALFMYLIAGLSALVGPGVIALRLAGALCGAATVVAVAFLGATFYNRRVGVLAAAFLAGLYWHLHVSRLGERTIMVPLLDTLALLAIWLAFRRRSIVLALVGGGLIGLQLYTYPSSRFFVVALVGIGLVEVAGAIVGRLGLTPSAPADRVRPDPPARLTILLGATILSAAVLATIPLAIHFSHVPSDFLGRADEVAIWNARVAGPSPLAAFATSAERTLAMFVLSGDPDWKYNLSFRPVFDPLGAAFFLIGLALALWRWRDRADRACLIWWICMLVPGFLSVDAPQFMRTLGAAPPTALFAARGLDALVRLGRRAKPKLIQRLAPALWGWPLVAGALASYQYFAVWAPSPAAYLALEGDVTDAARIIRMWSPRYGATYVASRYGADPTESFLDGDLFSRLHWFDGRSALPLPPPGAAPTLYVLPRTATDDYWYGRLPAADRVADVVAPDHGPAVQAFVLRPDALRPGSNASTIAFDFAGIARLLAAEVPPAAQAGGPLAPTFYWQIEKRPDEAVKFFVHLVDATGQTWTQYDEDVYPVSEWQAGQMLLVRRAILIPDDVPIGAYTLEVGLERASGEGLAATNQAGQSVGTSWRSGTISIIRPQRPPALSQLGIERPLDVLFGDSVRLVGVSSAPTTAMDGDAVAITLFWQVVRAPGGDLETIVQAVDRAGGVAAQVARPPTGGVWPARDWKPGDVVVDRQRVLIPAGTAPGSVTLTVGLRDATGRLLPPAGFSTVHVPIGGLTVRARPRSATTVTISHPQEVAFQDAIRLLGYDLEPTTARPGEAIQLTLYWQTRRPALRGWTVFTHLLDAREKIHAQHDAIPDGGHRPTTTWAPGETIVDRHTLVVQPDAPPGVERLEVGLYDAATGQRLKTADGGDRALLDQSVNVLGAESRGSGEPPPTPKP